MNQADKEEAFALISRILHLTRPTPELDALRELITRQKPDDDGERWRFCLKHGFPFVIRDGFTFTSTWEMTAWRTDRELVRRVGNTPNEAVDAARAAMKGTSCLMSKQEI